MTDLSRTIRETFPGKRIIIIGDIVADQFLKGTISRVSREAPVFILRHEQTDTLGGGAANAAVNVASLNGNPILIGFTGEDENGRLLLNTLRGAGVNCDFIITDKRLQTTTKIRVLAGQHYAPRQQVIRIDYEPQAAPTELHSRLIGNLMAASGEADAIIISDYNYNVADTNLIEAAREISRNRNIPLLVDSRFRLRDFPDATTATPNQEEIEMILKKNFTEDDCFRLCKELGYQSLLITRGNKGMLLIEANGNQLNIPAVGSAEPVDVTGAGDTVIAVYALGLASGLKFADAARLANHAGGIVVMKKGTASVSAEELHYSISSDSQQELSDSAR